MLLTAVGELCWQVKELMSLLKEAKLTWPSHMLGRCHLSSHYLSSHG